MPSRSTTRRRIARRAEDSSAADRPARTVQTARRGARPQETAQQAQSRNDSRAAERLSEDYFGLSLGFQWLATTRALETNHVARAAGELNAEADRISASRKLFDKSATAWKALTAFRSQLRKQWEAEGLPYPVAGIRLFPRTRLAEWTERIEQARAELRRLAAELQAVWPDLIAEARRALGDVFNAADYPASIEDQFAIVSHVPNLAPPEWLRDVAPAVYDAEMAAAKARFLESVSLAEAAAVAQVNDLLTALRDRLTGRDEEGRPLQVREASLANLREFVTWFRSVSIGNNSALDEVVSRVETLANSTTTEALRTDAAARSGAAQTAAELQTLTAAMLQARPLRKITLAGTKANGSNNSEAAQ